MKTNRPIYIFTGPVSALVFILLMAGNVYFYLQSRWQKASYDQVVAKMPLNPLLDKSPAFETDDQAVFNFTGDTVLILTPAKAINWKPAWNVLYKDHYGTYQTEDLPEEMLNKLEPDTTETATQ